MTLRPCPVEPLIVIRRERPKDRRVARGLGAELLALADDDARERLARWTCAPASDPVRLAAWLEWTRSSGR